MKAPTQMMCNMGHVSITGMYDISTSEIKCSRHLTSALNRRTRGPSPHTNAAQTTKDQPPRATPRKTRDHKRQGQPLGTRRRKTSDTDASFSQQERPIDYTSLRSWEDVLARIECVVYEGTTFEWCWTRWAHLNQRTDIVDGP